MVVLDATIVNIALPSAQRDLGFSTDSRQWVVTAYALAFGSLLLLGGKLGDLFGRKWTFIAGLAGFSAAWRHPLPCSSRPGRSRARSAPCLRPRRYRF
jgi:MFS family permease